MSMVKKWPFVLRLLQIITTLSICWSLAFLLISFLYDYGAKPKHWEEMLARGSTIAALYAAERNGDLEETVRQLASLRDDRLLLVDASGNRRAFGPEPGFEADTVSAADVQEVLAGGTVRKLPRHNPFRSGVATTGQPIEVAGERQALFIQTVTPSLFHDYGKQLFTILLSFVMMILFGMWGVRRHRRSMSPLQPIVEAMRRMAKGDFNVNLDAKPHTNGPFGPIVESLNDMAIGLNEMERMRQEFISNVSHEIQSPLTSISGFTRALHNDQLQLEERKRYLSIIETESRRLSKLSDNLLKLTSLESQHHPFEAKRFRLHKQIRNIVLACEPQWVEKSIEMDVSLEEIDLIADEELLSQVWINLINNSIKFTPVGGTIGIALTKRGFEAVVRIWDTGPGIADEDQAHIFERFYKADKSRNRSGSSGSGLGLSIVKKIVQMHKGSVCVDSTPGQGAQFTVVLPLVQD
ncbi:ATP-binding protein [Paenibacillus sp. HJGM_3]|uniref:ATP-binding protein n=1 Tax=Paenibacillus sp. HJGM_3 TaxID=3379816 RepID=UPI00385F3C42